MNIVRIKDKSQVTIPKEVRKELGVEPGDYLSVGLEGGKIVLSPQNISPKDNESKLSKSGEKRLDEALEDIKKGDVGVFNTVDEMINFMSD